MPKKSASDTTAVHRTHPDLVARAQQRLLVAYLGNADDLRPALLAAIRAGAPLPDDLDGRAWIADVLEGKHLPKRGRGRPSKRADVRPWTLALEAQRHKETADRVEFWRALIVSDRQAAEAAVRMMASQKGFKKDLFDTRSDLRSKKPSNIAARIVAELERPFSGLTAANVRRAVTRARK